MRGRSLFFVLLFGVFSCKQACGLTERDDGGGGGGGGTPTSVSGTSTTSSGGAACESAPASTPVCEDDFDGSTPCEFVDDLNCVGCGTWDTDTSAGVLIGTPTDAPTGFWAGSESLFHHLDSITEPFVAMTLVRPGSVSNPSGEWPTSPYQLAGIVIVGDGMPAESSRDWFKAEVGTIQDPSTIGMRTARKSTSQMLTEAPTPIDDTHEMILETGTNPYFQIGVCRVTEGRLHVYYRVEDAANEPWIEVQVGDVFMQGAARVGLVAAAGDVTPGSEDLVATFGYFRVETLASDASADDCRCWLEANINRLE